MTNKDHITLIDSDTIRQNGNGVLGHFCVKSETNFILTTTGIRDGKTTIEHHATNDLSDIVEQLPHCDDFTFYIDSFDNHLYLSYRVTSSEAYTTVLIREWSPDFYFSDTNGFKVWLLMHDLKRDSFENAEKRLTKITVPWSHHQKLNRSITRIIDYVAS